MQFRALPRAAPANLAMEWLAESYDYYSRPQFDEAWRAARAAVARLADFDLPGGTRRASGPAISRRAGASLRFARD